MHIEFPEPFKHVHNPVKNVNEIIAERLSFGQRSSDLVARIAGSWTFIIGQSIFFIIWAILNVTAWVKHWDPYPFILMNLVLSLQAAYTAPLIMMSQNRQSERDRLDAHNDYEINQKAEIEIKAILRHLAAQDKALAAIYTKVSAVDPSLLK